MLVRCDTEGISGNTGRLTIDGGYDVPPAGRDPDGYCPTLAARHTTRGGVKARYRE